MDLIHKTLCKDNKDYYNILSSLTIAQATIDCKNDIAQGVGMCVLKELFKKKCFMNVKIYYYKICNCESVLCYYLWEPEKSKCINEALEIVNKPCLKTFKDISNAFSKYLTEDNHKYDNVMIVIDALCNIIKQEIFLKQVFKKQLISL